ncbi:M81 family metallopeptidase [Arthrobacter oryzae]|uniref:M81 family metallopeptidase n=1 Tax=Arthrobacter oryzae TaxID=409290 RepID=UPI002860E133|nr:M81 family metallopeptidase [Arthrobacter oryzae]MDR6507653.1 microcystin degradation protein MlrC [Arthrobacter oryzae]
MHKPRVGIAGLATESSMFSPGSTTTPDFRPRRGQEVYAQYDFFNAGSPLWNQAEWLPALTGRAIPGPAVSPEAYEELEREILERLSDIGHLDGLYMDIHGAMHVTGREDAEADLLEAVRAVVGPDVLISASMDLHGNVSSRLVQAVDLLTCFRMAPHEDEMETKQRAITNLLDRLSSGKGRPLKAWVPVPVLLPGEQTSTRVEPAKSLYAKVAAVEASDGILDAGLWIGYAWADERRAQAAVVVVGDDSEAVTRGAESLAKELWEVRDRFDFVAPACSLEDALALAADPTTSRPFFISDSGDNPTAGGSGDVTHTLAHLLENQSKIGVSNIIYASIPDPSAAQEAQRLGVGGRFRFPVGAKVDKNHQGPVLLDGTVHELHLDSIGGIEAVIQVGRVAVIVTENRKPFHYEQDFLNLGLSPRLAHVVVVKIGYLEPELFDMAAEWRLALTPGGVDQDLRRLSYSRIRRPMFPFDDFAKDPDLSARIVPNAGT